MLVKKSVELLLCDLLLVGWGRVIRVELDVRRR